MALVPTLNTKSAYVLNCREDMATRKVGKGEGIIGQIRICFNDRNSNLDFPQKRYNYRNRIRCTRILILEIRILHDLIQFLSFLLETMPFVYPCAMFRLKSINRNPHVIVKLTLRCTWCYFRCITCLFLVIEVIFCDKYRS